MTNPVSSDKISTAYTPSNANSAKSTSKEASAVGQNDGKGKPSADTANLERASARYAQSVQGESSINSADQARGRAALLRDLIGADPKAALQAHGEVTQVKVDAAMLAP